MYKIKFGTDGWRAIIAEGYTVDNLKRVTAATAEWLKGKSNLPNKVVIGHDCRFGGKLFLESSSSIFADYGIKVVAAEKFVTTPMVSMAAKELNAGLGIVITASHNPPTYNGYKIKAHYGGPASPKDVQEVEDLIQDIVPSGGKSFEEHVENGLISFYDMEGLYVHKVQNAFDLKAIQSSGLRFAYDAMYGAGQDAVPRILPETTLLHCEDNPGFHGQAPEPIHKNLLEFSDLIKGLGNIDSGLATDGDADRVGLYNKAGKFIDSHHIILLLIKYLHKYKGLSGKVVHSFSCTSKIDKLCDLYGLPHQTTKIGFKYICDIMVEDDVLIGGEESGGIAIKGHIPERDGIWIGLVIWEYMTKTGKSLDDLIAEIYDEVGSFAVERYDLHISEDLKQEIVQKCKDQAFTSFGAYTIERVEDIDGYKHHLGNEEWVMIRPSGTEPVLRVYAESSSSENAFKILDATKESILG
jgi:phosphomannomutase